MNVIFLFLSERFFCVNADAHRFGLFLQVDNLRKQVCDFLLLASRILRLPGQLLRDGGDLQTGLSWRPYSQLS